MRRRPLGEPADRQQVKALLKKNNPGWMQTRLCALKMGFNAENSKALIAESLGVSERSVTRWLNAFRKHGLNAVLERGYGIGRPSGLDEEVQAYLLKGLEHARWNTAAQARKELSEHFGRNFKYATVWTWLKNARGCFEFPAPCMRKGTRPKQRRSSATFWVSSGGFRLRAISR